MLKKITAIGWLVMTAAISGIFDVAGFFGFPASLDNPYAKTLGVIV